MFGPSQGDKVQHAIKLNDQSDEISEENGERASHLIKDENFPTFLFEDAKTMYEAMRRGSAVSKNGDCLGYRKEMPGRKMPYVWLKYEEVLKRSAHLAQGMVEKGMAIGQQTLIGIYSTNRPEWVITEQACYVYSMVNVPLYDTLGLEACSFILKQTEIRMLFVDKPHKAEKLLTRRNEFPELAFLVMIEKPTWSLTSKAQETGVELIEFKQLEELGQKAAAPKPHQPPTPDDLATICYTSGTTGMPKGAMLSHLNIMADLSANWNLNKGKPRPGDTMISYLPLAHVFERVVEALLYTVGGRVGFYRGDIKMLLEDLQELKPTIMPTVPRLLNRVYDKVMQEVNKSIIKKFLFSYGMSAKLAEVKRGYIRSNSFWDWLMFRKVQTSMGGRLRLMLTGSAPLSEEVMNFCRATMGCIVVEGYGQTECVAGATLTVEGDSTPGHVGPPIPCNKIKVVDVPDMKYFAKDGCGEVCIKGPNVMRGYFKEPEHTAAALDADGWLHTGDIGRWTAQGTLKLIDRKKHIFKLAQGEYIVPDKIENVYNRSQYVAQSFIYGESVKSCLVAIVVPDETIFTAVDKELGIKGTMQELCQNPDVKTLILKDMTIAGQKAGLASFEQAKAIYLHPEPFTVENNLLTPTFKMKRNTVKEFFKVELAKMYESPHLN